MPSWGTGADESVSWMTSPGPVIATRPAAIRASWSCWLRSRGHRGAALAGGLELLDRRAQVEDLLLEAPPAAPGGRARSRRAASAPGWCSRMRGPSGGELRGDQEAERQQGDAERDLPARDRADACGRARSRRAAPATARDGEHGTDDRPRRARGRAARGRWTAGRARRGRPVRRGAGAGVSGAPAADAPAAPRARRPRPAADPPARRQRTRAARAAVRSARGSAAPRSSSQPAWNAARSSPSAAVNASSSVRPSAYAVDERDQRVAGPSCAHEVVDGRHGLRVGEERRCRRRSGTGRRGRSAG